MSSGFVRNSERAHSVQTKCTFCGGTNHYAEKCFKIKERKNPARLMFRTTDERNVRFGNVLDVDLKII